jgi:type IV pilus assembly protein PilW
MRHNKMTSKHLGHAMRGNIKVAGFSLIELMISITIGLIILSGMLVVFANTNATRNEIDRTNRQIENGRYALEILRDDIQLAGFYGEMNWGNFIAPSNVAAAMPATMPDPCTTTLTERTTGGGTQGVLRLHVQGVDDYIAGTLSCLTGANAVKPGTDVIVVRRAKTCEAGATGCDLFDAAGNNPYLQVSLCSTATTTHTLGPGTATFSHKLKNCTTDAPKRPYVIYMYFVGTDNVLKRAEFTGTAMGNVTSLVDGVENMQIEYGVDTIDAAASPPDGNPNTYLSATNIGLVATMPVPEAWSNVVTVKIHLLARNTEASPGYTDTKSYTLGAVTVAAANDNIRRHVYTSLVRIQNVSGRRETP